MSIHILDASAMFAYANAEPGGTVVQLLLNDPDAICYAPTMNLCPTVFESPLSSILAAKL